MNGEQPIPAAAPTPDKKLPRVVLVCGHALGRVVGEVSGFWEIDTLCACRLVLRPDEAFDVTAYIGRGISQFSIVGGRA